MKPMNLKTSLLFFGIPGLVIFLMFKFIYTLLLKYGLPIWWATYLCTWGPLIILILIVMIFYSKSNIKFKDYFWINNLKTKELLFVLIGFITV